MALNLYHMSAATVMRSHGLHNLPAWQLKSLGVQLQTATISQLAQRLRQSARSAAGLGESTFDALVETFLKLQISDRTSSTAERARMKAEYTAIQQKMLLQQRQVAQKAAQKADEVRNSKDVTRQIESLLAAIAALQRAIEKALRAFALETVAALTIVLLALQAELKNLISQPGIVST